MMTAAQIARTQNDWARIANEPVRVEVIGAAIYGFASELATLRLLKKYRNSSNTDCGYSANLESFYFVLELQA